LADAEADTNAPQSASTLWRRYAKAAAKEVVTTRCPLRRTILAFAAIFSPTQVRSMTASLTAKQVLENRLCCRIKLAQHLGIQ
jgi:hypothetical protein